MNTVWTLIVILNFGYNSATAVTINQIPTYAECSRVEKLVSNMNPESRSIRTLCAAANK